MTVRSSVLRRRLRLVYMADVSYDELTLSMAGRDSSVGMATRYGLDGPDIESQWGVEIFHTRSHRPWGSPSLLYKGYSVFPGEKAAGAWR